MNLPTRLTFAEAGASGARVAVFAVASVKGAVVDGPSVADIALIPDCRAVLSTAARAPEVVDGPRRAVPAGFESCRIRSTNTGNGHVRELIERHSAKIGGGLRYAERVDPAIGKHQLAIAELTHARPDRGAWPVCGGEAS